MVEELKLPGALATVDMDSSVLLRERFAPVPLSIPADLLRSSGDAPPPPAELATIASDESWRSRLISVARSWLGSLVIHLTGIIVLALGLGMIPPVVRPAAEFLTFASPAGGPVAPVSHFTLGGGGSPAGLAGQSSPAAFDELLKTEPTPFGEHVLLPSTHSPLEASRSATLPALDNLLSPLATPSPLGGGTKAGSGGSGRGGSGGKGAVGKGAGGSGGLGTNFFGVRAGGRKFVYIVDSSHSMRGEKFATAQEEVLYAITQLSVQQSFYVFFFDQITQPMVLSPDKEPPPEPVPATRDNVKRASKWIKGVETGTNTHPYEAVKLALAMRPDAIFLLTDGQFSDNGQTEQYLLINNVLERPTKEPQVIVHTIGFWDLAGQEALQRIAQRNGGTYRYVPPGGR